MHRGSTKPELGLWKLTNTGVIPCKVEFPSPDSNNATLKLPGNQNQRSACEREMSGKCHASLGASIF